MSRVVTFLHPPTSERTLGPTPAHPPVEVEWLDRRTGPQEGSCPDEFVDVEGSPSRDVVPLVV